MFSGSRMMVVKPHRRFLSLLQHNKTNIRSFSSASASAQQQQASDYGNKRRPWLASFLKFGFFSALTGAVGGAAYATYAYSLEDIEITTKGIREYTQYNTTKDDALILEKFQSLLYSAAMTVPAKSIEMYLNLRRLMDDKAWENVKLLPDMDPNSQRARVFTLVLDLNDTLVYTDWKPERGWKTFKRPGVDAFLERLSQYYEIIVYTDQPSEYADPIARRLDRVNCVLSKFATKYQNGQRYRDLSKLNRDPARIIYVSGHALESCLQPENSVPVKAWKLEADDRSLLDLIPFLEYVGRYKPEDIRTTLATYKDHDIPTEFSRRAKIGGLWRR